MIVVIRAPPTEGFASPPKKNSIVVVKAQYSKLKPAPHATDFEVRINASPRTQNTNVPRYVGNATCQSAPVSGMPTASTPTEANPETNAAWMICARIFAARLSAVGALVRNRQKEREGGLFNLVDRILKGAQQVSAT